MLLPINAKAQQFARVPQRLPVDEGRWSFGGGWVDSDNDGDGSLTQVAGMVSIMQLPCLHSRYTV